MMTLEEVIIENSNNTIKGLYSPAQKAFKEPATGITVVIPAAAAVIRDCAMVTLRYLPHYTFGLYGNPFTELKGKISVQQITDFVQKSKTDFITNQLLQLIKDRSGGIVAVPQATNFADPYQEYEAATEQVEHNDIYLLSKLFGVI